MADIALSLVGVTARRGSHLVLDGVMFTVPEDETVVLLGEAGAGKTTLLQILTGAVRPEMGAVFVRGQDVTRMREGRRKLGIIRPVLPVKQSVRRALAAAGARRDRVTAALDLYGLTARARDGVDRLTGGEIHRLSLARAWAAGAAALLLDDPSEEFARTAADAGGTLLIATRLGALALSLGAHAAVLDRGTIVQQGRAAELYDTPRSAQVARRLGPANILSGTVRELRPGALVWTRAGRFVQAIEGDESRPVLGGKLTLCLRPERVVLVGPDAPADNAIEGAVTSVRPMGSRVEIGARTALGDLTASIAAWPSGVWPPVGTMVRLAWAADAAVLLAETEVV